MLPSWARQTITVVEPSLVDDRGTLVADFDTPASETVVPGCSVQPGASEEFLASRQGVAVRWSVYAPPGTVVSAHSGVRFEGNLYHVDGEPLRWSSPTGAADHVVLLLVDHEG